MIGVWWVKGVSKSTCFRISLHDHGVLIFTFTASLAFAFSLLLLLLLPLVSLRFAAILRPMATDGPWLTCFSVSIRETCHHCPMCCRILL